MAQQPNPAMHLTNFLGFTKSQPIPKEFTEKAKQRSKDLHVAANYTPPVLNTNDRANSMIQPVRRAISSYIMDFSQSLLEKNPYRKIFLFGMKDDTADGIDIFQGGNLGIFANYNFEGSNPFLSDCCSLVDYLKQKHFPRGTASQIWHIDYRNVMIMIETPDPPATYDPNLPTFDLLRDAWFEVFQHLDLYSVSDMALVCKDFRDLVNEGTNRWYQMFEFNTVRADAELRAVSLPRYQLLQKVFINGNAHSNKFLDKHLKGIPPKKLQYCKFYSIQGVSETTLTEFVKSAPDLRTLIMDSSPISIDVMNSIASRRLTKLRIELTGRPREIDLKICPQLVSVSLTSDFSSEPKNFPQSLQFLNLKFLLKEDQILKLVDNLPYLVLLNVTVESSGVVSLLNRLPPLRRLFVAARNTPTFLSTPFDPAWRKFKEFGISFPFQLETSRFTESITKYYKGVQITPDLVCTLHKAELLSDGLED